MFLAVSFFIEIIIHYWGKEKTADNVFEFRICTLFLCVPVLDEA